MLMVIKVKNVIVKKFGKKPKAVQIKPRLEILAIEESK